MFEFWRAENYLQDWYIPGKNIQSILSRIQKNRQEKNIHRETNKGTHKTYRRTDQKENPFCRKIRLIFRHSTSFIYWWFYLERPKRMNYHKKGYRMACVYSIIRLLFYKMCKSVVFLKSPAIILIIWLLKAALGTFLLLILGIFKKPDPMPLFYGLISNKSWPNITSPL